MHDLRAVSCCFEVHPTYICGTLHLGLVVRPCSQYDLVVYLDTDWTRCFDIRKSTSRYAIFLGGNLISWSSKCQDTISRLSMEAEHRTITKDTWLHQLLLDELQTPLCRATLVYCDNVHQHSSMWKSISILFMSIFVLDSVRELYVPYLFMVHWHLHQGAVSRGQNRGKHCCSRRCQSTCLVARVDSRTQESQRGRNGLSWFGPINALHPEADDPYTQEHPKSGGYNRVYRREIW